MSYVPGLISQLRAVAEEVVRDQQRERHDRPNEPGVFPAHARELGRGSLTVCDGAIGLTTRGGEEFTHVTGVVPLLHGPHGRIVLTLDAGRQTIEVTLAARREARLRRSIQRAGLTLQE